MVRWLTFSRINAKLGGTNSLPRSGPVTQMVRAICLLVREKDVDCLYSSIRVASWSSVSGCVVQYYAMFWSHNRSALPGADVGHPGPGVTDRQADTSLFASLLHKSVNAACYRPSICSLTASIDPDATKYISRAFIQHPRQECMDTDKLERMVYVRAEA